MAVSPAVSLGVTNASKSFEKRSELEARFGVRIGRAGEMVAEKNGVKRSGRSYCIARDPDLEELAALEFALLRSYPGRRHALSILFLKEGCYGDRCATWTQDREGRPVVLVEPRRSRLDDPLELVFLHELAHDAMFRMGLNPDRAGEWKYAEILGWQRFANHKAGEKGWMIRSAEGYGTFYKLGKYTQEWIKCDGNGNPVTGADNAPVHSRRAFAPGAEYVRSVAVVKPATDYFDNPFEVLAEGLMLYRAGSETRGKLMVTSPKLHEIVRQFDDCELREIFGKDAVVRQDDGVISPNPLVVLAR